jgi:hypothetical protein
MDEKVVPEAYESERRIDKKGKEKNSATVALDEEGVYGAVEDVVVHDGLHRLAVEEMRGPNVLDHAFTSWTGELHDLRGKFPTREEDHGISFLLVTRI